MSESTVIYIGGIPYDQTEDQILQIAKSVGPIITSKLLFDKETGKSKGYAFIKYKDLETAKSAIRNLNNYQIGNRFLKCNYSNDLTLNNLLNSKNYDSKFLNLEKKIPPLPPGLTLNDLNIDNLNNIITSSLNSLNLIRLKNLINDTKLMSIDNPELMEVLFIKNPQLLFALIQATMMIGLSGPEDIKKMLLPEPESETEQTQDTEVKEQEPIPTDTNTNTNTPTQEEEVSTTTSITQELQNLSKEQLDTIKLICSMTDEDILNKVAANEQELYFEIKKKFGIYIT